MEVGIVKWFNNAKGFGFIVSEKSKSDVFAHFSAIETEGKGYRSLRMGQKVFFEWIDSEKGACASRIIPFME